MRDSIKPQLPLAGKKPQTYCRAKIFGDFAFRDTIPEFKTETYYETHFNCSNSGPERLCT